MPPDERTASLPAGTVTFLAADDGALDGFESATDAVTAALARRSTQPRAALALHTGEARLLDDDTYTGPGRQRAVRLLDLAGEGRTLLSSATATLVAGALPPGTALVDLGLHRLRDLSHPERVFEVRSDHQAIEAAPLRSLDAVPNNLPVQLTTFLGRSEELEAVKVLLATDRLVTLTGPGGSGKTRLAMQAAADAAERFPSGVWWVELAQLSDPALVAEAVTSALGLLVEPVGGPLRALEVQLGEGRMLLCLDNCEHVLAAAAEVAETVMRTCPEVTVLATSREPLGVAGELVWRVPALCEDEAISLFVERASRVRPWFTLDATNDAAVRSMCERLDGMPLALELAAAWLRTLTPAQIAAGLDDRFALLVRGARGADARQQSLEASMDWSHDLLGEGDRSVFRQLSVFAGGFTLEAARDVAGAGDDVLDALGRLVDKSLVVMEEHGGAARFRMLETVRQYAATCLHRSGDHDRTRDRHLRHYLELVEAAEGDLDVDHARWRATVAGELDNLRAALEWGLTADDAEPGRRLAAALAPLWNLRRNGHEGIEVLQRAIARAPEDDSALQARLLTGLALVADTTGPLQLELDAAQRGLAIATAAGDGRSRARCLLLAAIARFYVDFDAASATTEEARLAGEESGDPFVRDGAEMLAGIILASRGHHAEARPLLEASTARLRERDDRAVATTGIGYLADAALHTGELERAIRIASGLVELAAPLGDYYVVGAAAGHLALATGMRGDPVAGRRIMDEVVRAVEGTDRTVYIPRLAPVLGSLALWLGDLGEAAHWFERDAGSADPAADGLIALRVLPGLAATRRLQGRLDDAAKAADRAAGIARRLGVAHLHADALEQSALVAEGDDPDRADQLHHEALAIRVERGLRTFYVDSLDGLAALAALAEDWTDAARLDAASDAARQAMGYPRPPVAVASHDRLVAGVREAMGEPAFAAARAEGGRLSLDEAVTYVRRARGTRGRPSSGWRSLTPTELEVVRLVAAGLSNPEIGARLLMGRGTVKTHLSHIYAKLTVANRTELATLASAHGVVTRPR